MQSQGIQPRTVGTRDQRANHYTTISSCKEMLKFLNIIPIHFEQNLAHSKIIDIALIVRAGEICFRQNLAHSKNEVKRICRHRESNPVPFV